MSFISGEECFCKEPSHKKCHLNRKPHFPCQLLIALNSNTGGAGPLPAVAALPAPINIVSVAVDADIDNSRHDHLESDFCTERVRILLIFTAIINLPAAIAATLIFQLVRTTNHGAPVTIGPTFTFRATVAALTSASFAFQFFDTGLEPDDYTYSVVLAPGSSIVTEAASAITITNAVLSAIAVI